MDQILVPVKVDCFILNESVCSPKPTDVSTAAKIAPITQPNYTYLRYDKKYLANDILRHTDLHATSRAATNSRIYDLGSGQPLANRQGVYIHWMIPRPYRSGNTTSERTALSQHSDPGPLTDTAGLESTDNDEFPATIDSDDDPVITDPNKKDSYLAVPQFPDVPTRWLVIRRIDLSTIKPDTIRTSGAVSELTGWIVESDHMQMIDDIDDSIDLQTDVSPFIDSRSKQVKQQDGKLIDKVNINHQAEVFIGSKWPANDWKEDDTRVRAKINLGQASNQLFADFQIHNGNVFSMVDNLYCDDGKTRIMEATCDYFVVGWHTTNNNPDLFSVLNGTRQQRLGNLNMVLQDSTNKTVTDWTNSSDPARTLCHGSKYVVKWSMTDAPWIPADDYCASLMGSSRLSVATTPLDSILTYVHAHSQDADPIIKNLATSLELIEAMLVARDDGVEPLQRAISMVGNNNFRRQGGGRYVYLADSDDAGTSASGTGDGTGTGTATSGTATGTGPTSSSGGAQTASSKQKKYTDADIDTIKQFNKAFLKMDTMTSLTTKLQWDMFALWWLGVSDRGENRDLPKLRQLVDLLRTRFQGMSDALAQFALNKATPDDLKKGLTSTWKNVFTDELPGPNSNPKEAADLKDQRTNILDEAKLGVQSPFFQPGDPTLLVAGVPSGWPHDYLDPLVARLGYQVNVAASTNKLPNSWSSFIGNIAGRVPRDFAGTLKALFDEFYLLQATDYGPAPSKSLPLYHDKYPRHDTQLGHGTNVGRDVNNEDLWRDRWNDEQPFFPLYFEWEVEYYHIPFDYWRLEDSAIDQSHPSKVRYVIDTDKLNKASSIVAPEGRRAFSGRSLILPQPSFSLKAKIDALYSQLPQATLNNLIDEEQRKAISTALQQLPFLSSPLSGFADNLLTKLQGTHVKCNNKASNGVSVPIEMAITTFPMDGGQPIITRDDLAYIQSQSDMTPYGALVEYSDDQNIAFKPVTHGQFRFTKLNIIDKFGQAIHAMNPDPQVAPEHKVPCKGEYYTTQQVLDTQGNDYDFIQIPPQINQPARLNASFVRLKSPTQDNLYWEPLIEWENPVWGWVVINYANYGLQFFLPDGTFYREVRSGGRTGALGSAEWIPFPPPTSAPPTGGSVHVPGSNPDAVKQLQNLINKLSADADYLKAFIEVIDKCLPTLIPAPSAYASQSSVAIGRPLALVNMGWSMELATEPYKNQMITGTTSLPRKLANDDSLLDKTVGDDPVKQPDPSFYSFQVIFGSREKAWDALVGFFPSKVFKEITDNGDALDLDNFYTYYPPTIAPATNPKQPPSPAWRFLKVADDPYRFRPFYLNPLYQDRTLDDLSVLRAKRQHVFGALMDPFTSVHAYSSILPIKELSLPPWVVEQAFAKMSTFFSIGPVLMPKPLPNANASGQVRLTEIVDNGQPIVQPGLGLPVPVSTLGGWNWLQPYPSSPVPQSAAGSSDVLPGTDTPQRFYTRFKLDKVDQRMRFEDGPYTAVEGYLQLRNPTEKPNPTQASVLPSVAGN